VILSPIIHQNVDERQKIGKDNRVVEKGWQKCGSAVLDDHRRDNQRSDNDQTQEDQPENVFSFFHLPTPISLTNAPEITIQRNVFPSLSLLDLLFFSSSKFVHKVKNWKIHRDNNAADETSYKDEQNRL